MLIAEIIGSPLSPVRELRVGADTKTRSFHVHESLLTSRSDLFKSLTTERWIDVLENSDNDPDIFGLYVTLIYTGKFATKGEDEWKKLWQLYILSDNLVDAQAQKETLNAMQSLMWEFVRKRPIFFSNSFPEESPICGSSINEIYAGTKKGDPIRRLVVEFYVDEGRYSWLSGEREKLPNDFLYGVVAQMMRKKEKLPLGAAIYQPAPKSPLPTSTTPKSESKVDPAIQTSADSKSTPTKKMDDADLAKRKTRDESPGYVWRLQNGLENEANTAAKTTSTSSGPFSKVFEFTKPNPFLPHFPAKPRSQSKPKNSFGSKGIVTTPPKT